MTKPTYEECAAAGMTKKEAARAMGKSPSAVQNYANKHGIAFRKAMPNGVQRNRRRTFTFSFDDDTADCVRTFATDRCLSFPEAVQILVEMALEDAQEAER